MRANKKPTVLVVDDEKRILDLIRIMLESEGYQVYSTESAREAIKIASNPDAAIDLLLTDILMPQMNGRELANRIFSIKPFIRVLFISAYSAEILDHHKFYPDGADFIRKPFTKEELTDKISRIMASSIYWRDLVSKQP